MKTTVIIFLVGNLWAACVKSNPSALDVRRNTVHGKELDYTSYEDENYDYDKYSYVEEISPSVENGSIPPEPNRPILPASHLTPAPNRSSRPVPIRPIHPVSRPPAPIRLTEIHTTTVAPPPTEATSDPEQPSEDPLLNHNIFEGDILGYKTVDEDGLSNRNAIINPTRKWKYATIPYEISPRFSKEEMTSIRRAMGEYHKHTCIKFMPRRVESVDYIYIQPHPRACNSWVGRIGGKQEINLMPWCAQTLGTVIHELMHAAGFWHEQSRSDRDNHVTIHWDHIEDENKHNFKKYNREEVQDFRVPYDVGSVMHYPSTAFTIDRTAGLHTITAKNGDSSKMGQRRGFSRNDILKINRLYRCK